MSNYTGIDVKIDNNDGSTTPVVGATIHVYDVTNDTALADLPTVTDASGHVPAGTLAVAAGTTIRFWVNLGNGLVGLWEEETT